MKNRSEKFYDRFTLLYPMVELFLSPQKRKFFREINRFPSGRLLEIGIGNGSNLRYYNTHKIFGVDTSVRMLEEAKRYQRNDVELFHMDGQNLEFANESFDYVVLSHVIAVADNPGKLLKEAHRVLKPGGKVFILNHFTPDNFLGYVDKIFAWLSRLFHFRSNFPLSQLQCLGDFEVKSELNAGLFSYFKILIYEKKL